MSTYSTASTHLTTREILIADASVEDLSVLLNGIDDNVDVWLVQRDEDAMPYIFNALADPTLSKLHLLAHGVAGGILLGNKTVKSEDFSRRFDGAAQRDLDIAFWSCETGAGAEGLAFVETVANATGARVSATSGLVGAKSQHGSWELDVVVKPPFSAKALGEYGHVLAFSLSSTKPGNATSIIDAINNNDDVTIAAGAIVTGTAANLVTALTHTAVNGQTYTISNGVNIIVSDGISLADLAIIKNYVTTGNVTYTKLQDTLSNLTGNTAEISAIHSVGGASLVVTDATTTISQLSTLKTNKSFAGTVTAQNITDTAAALATNAGLTGTAVFITSGTNVTINETSSQASLAQLALIDSKNGAGSLTYTKVTGLAADFVDAAGTTYTANANTYVLAGTSVTVSDSTTLAQLAAIDVKNDTGALIYTSISDTKLQLEADTKYIYGSNLTVKVVDAATTNYTVAQLDTLKATFGIGNNTGSNAFTGTLIAPDITDTAANLAPANVASAYIGSGTNVTVDSSATTPATIAQLTALDAKNVSGSLTYTAVSDLAANLLPSGSVSSYITSTNGKNIAVTDSGAVSIANLVAIDAANSNGTITLAGSITGSIADYFTTPTGTTFKDGVSALITALSTKNIAITDAATVAQAAAIYALDTHLDLTGGLTGIAADFAATNGTLVTSPAVATLLGLTTKPVVTITDAASIAQIKNVDTGNSTSGVNYTSISDLAANLYTGGTLTADAATYIVNSVNVLVSNSASSAGLGAIDAATGGTVTAGSLTDSASSLVSSIYVASGTNVTINDGSAVSLSTLLALNTKIGSGTITFATNAITGTALDFATAGGG